MHGRSFLWATTIPFSIVVITTQLLVLFTDAQETEFLSIDCGTSSLRNYTDPTSRIQWVPDNAIWPDIGKWSAVSAVINLPSGMSDQVQYSTFRSFPPNYKALNQSKFCYTLPAVSDNYYLIRASFWYDPSAAGVQIRFRVIVDTYQGVEIVIDLPQALPWFEEMYVRAQTRRSSVSVCLAAVSGSSYPPFINSLELRPLPSALKPLEMIRSTNTALRTVLRQDAGVASETIPPFILRYPDDTLDRFWWRISAASSVNLQGSSQAVAVNLPDLPPIIAMETNYVGDMTGYTWNVSYVPSLLLSTSTIKGGSHYYYVGFWFAELDPLVYAAGQRVFEVTINGVLKIPGVDVYGEAGGRYVAIERYPTEPSGPYVDQLVIGAYPVGASKYPPTLAAAEALQLFDIPMNATTPTSPSDVLAIQDIVTSTMPTLRSFIGDPCLPLDYKYPWIGCDSTNPSLPARVTSISLSNYGLTGNLLSSIGNLDQLVSLDLSNNSLGGTIPASLSSLPKLRYLNVANNKFTGTIPAGLLQKQSQGLLDFHYEGNNFGDSPAPGNKNLPLIIGASVGAIVLAIVVVITIVCICKRRRNKPTAQPFVHDTQLVQRPQLTAVPNPQDPANYVNFKKEELIRATNVAKEFSFQEIQIATNNRSELLGRGGFGRVYKGTLSTGSEVAVKVLAKVSEQGAQEFLNEVTLLSRVHHKNLVGFVGYSIQTSLVLVYEFMSNGSLYDALFKKKTSLNLTWRQRLQIVFDAAQGLSYLHHGCNIIHRDVKSSNILLSKNLEGKMSDFGISRLTPDGIDNVATTRVVGTVGYLDPTYANTFMLTEKADIYSFGVVLLEVICGKPPILRDADKTREMHLTDWVRASYKKGMIDEIVDERFEGRYKLSSVWKVAEIAVACVQFEAENRPTMVQICNDLNDAISLEESYEYSSPAMTGEVPPYSHVSAR